MAVQKVTAVKASYAQTILGNAYAKDATIPKAEVAKIRHLDAYLSKGRLYTVPDRYARRPGSHQYNATALNPASVTGLS